MRTGGLISPPLDAVARYFARRYPARSSLLSGAVVRRGQGELGDLLRSWLPQGDGFDLLDAGCGDGALLASSLRARPRRLRFEDLVPSNVDVATERFRGRAEQIEGVVGDAASIADASLYDVVVALGVLDYHPEWKTMLGALVARARGTLICDVPREDRLHHRLRRIWLSSQGISLQIPARTEVASALEELGGRSEIAFTRFSMCVRLRVGRGSA